MHPTLTIYTDYKSPYAFLATGLTYALAEEFPGLQLEWLPHTLDIPSYLGSARLDDAGNVIEENRDAHQWRKVRYAYMDCRRYARLRGLTLLAPRKIWDSSIANIGMLYAQEGGPEVFRRYHDITFERFFRRALDIESEAVVTDVLREAGADPTTFPDFLRGPGRERHDRIREESLELGVFGVPTYVLDGEVFWGREHLDLIRLRLGASMDGAGTSS